MSAEHASGERPEPLLTTQDLAAQLGRDPQTIRRWVKQRDNPCPVALRLPGGHYRFREADVLRWLGGEHRTSAADAHAEVARAQVQAVIRRFDIARQNRRSR